MSEINKKSLFGTTEKMRLSGIIQLFAIYAGKLKFMNKLSVGINGHLMYYG